MFEYGLGPVGYYLTLISLIHVLFACVVSMVVIIVIIYHQYHHRMNVEEKITLAISLHIYLFIWTNTLIFILMNSWTLIGDIYGKNFDSIWCITLGYCLFVSGYGMFYSFAIQVNLGEDLMIDA